MTLLVRFLVYNLLLSLAAGSLAWLIVFTAVRLLGIRSSLLTLCFFSLPVFKSILVLLGVGLVFSWPVRWFENWHKLALPFDQALPVILIWAGGTTIVYLLIVHRARQATLRGAQPASEVAPRLASLFETVLEGFQKIPCPLCSDDLCCAVELKMKPRLLVSERINSPLALTEGGEPLILFPAGLISRLSDDELAGALAHEIAHFHLHLPGWCSAGILQRLTWVNPSASLAGEYLHRQEEKACDELAISIVGKPELYAGMLTKSYRFAKEQADRTALGRLQVLPRLIGFKPLLSERVEHLLSVPPNPQSWKQSRVVACLVWAMLFWVLFPGLLFIPS